MFKQVFLIVTSLSLLGCSGPVRPKAGQQSFTNRGGISFRLIPKGRFEMGSPDDDVINTNTNARPQHEVTIPDDFYIGTHEISQAQWQVVMGNNPSTIQGPDLPVNNISWDDAQNFVSRLNDLEGTKEYRLPTEAEWEYAARAASPWEPIKTNSQAWYYANSGDKPEPKDLDRADYSNLKRYKCRPRPVGQKAPNAWGLYDMQGNVWEFVEDRYHLNYTGSPTDGSADQADHPADTGNRWRALRGGAWDSPSWNVTPASRNGVVPSYRWSNQGLRVAYSPKK